MTLISFIGVKRLWNFKSSANTNSIRLYILIIYMLEEEWDKIDFKIPNISMVLQDEAF
jgi:hypothetical protein